MQLRRSTGLVGHWKFNEKSGITANDSSRYRNTGTLTGATHLPKWGEKGIIFDGVDDCVQLPNTVKTGTSNLSLSLWFKSANISATQVIAIQNGPVILGVTNSKLGYVYVIYGDSSWKALYGNTTLVSNRWYNYVLIYNGTNITYYLDGVMDGQTAKTGNLSGLSSFWFGGYTSGGQPPSSNFFNGSIDDVYIYNRALSASEIKRHYDSTKHKYI